MKIDLGKLLDTAQMQLSVYYVAIGLSVCENNVLAYCSGKISTLNNIRFQMKFRLTACVRFD